MKNINYDKFPSTGISGKIDVGWEAIRQALDKQLLKSKVLIVDLYTGTHENELIKEFERIPHDIFINTRSLMKPEKEVRGMTNRFMTDDVLFGYVTNLCLADYFDPEKLKAAKQKLRECSDKVVVFGTGAALLAGENATVVYADMARWEIQQRFRRHEVKALGIDNHDEPVSIQYKRGYFNDWRILDRYKSGLSGRVDYWLDTHIPATPKMIDRDTFFRGINKTVQSPFRVVPFFDPAPWGGQWMKEVCGLDRETDNFGWCFDCVPEENSLLLNVDGTTFEMPSFNLVLLKTTELLGEPVEARFGKDFPIRFDFLDTFGGGNLSLQVHPTTQYIRENFGMQYTQDESYYLLDAGPDATVYIGLKTGVNPDEMVENLREAQRGEHAFDTEKYVNKVPARKHDHFLIPGGTIHCSGAEALVLEISSTPNIFTFKLWDWDRLGLDGVPRPINVERGKDVIDWKRDTDYVHTKLMNRISEVREGDGWREEKTGLHQNEFIETRRHWFTKTVTHHTNNSVNVLNLVEGEEAVIESPAGSFDPFIVHYAETFIIPASVGEYTVTPHGKASGTECATIKAYIRFQ